MDKFLNNIIVTIVNGSQALDNSEAAFHFSRFRQFTDSGNLQISSHFLNLINGHIFNSFKSFLNSKTFGDTNLWVEVVAGYRCAVLQLIWCNCIICGARDCFVMFYFVRSALRSILFIEVVSMCCIMTCLLLGFFNTALILSWPPEAVSWVMLWNKNTSILKKKFASQIIKTPTEPWSAKLANY